MYKYIKAFWSNISFAQKTLLIYFIVLFFIDIAIYFDFYLRTNGQFPDIVGNWTPLSAFMSLSVILLSLAEIDNILNQDILVSIFIAWLISIPILLLVRYFYFKVKQNTTKGSKVTGMWITIKMNFLPILGAPAAFITVVTYLLLWDRAIIYHDPLGYYYLAMMVSVPVLLFFYAIGFVLFASRQILAISATEIFTNIYFYHLIGFLSLSAFWGEQTFFLIIILSFLSIVFNLSYSKSLSLSQLRPWFSQHTKFLLGLFALVAFIFPISAVIFIAKTIPEPPTPFELRAQTMSCQTYDDCKAFNCTGYNVGAWFCDSDGYPRCDLEKKTCGCSVGCL